MARWSLVALMLAVVWIGSSGVASADGAIRSPASSPPATGQPHVSLDSLSSYRFTLSGRVVGTLLGEQLTIEVTNEGEVVAPDRYHGSCRETFGGEEIVEETIVIGNRSWVNDERTDGQFVRRRPVLCEDDSTPAGFLKDAPISTILTLPASDVTIGGVPAVRYHLDRDTPDARERFRAILELRPDELAENADFVFDLWVAKDGDWPVRLVISVDHLDEETEFIEIVMDIFDVNDPSIRVDEP